MNLFVGLISCALLAGPAAAASTQLLAIGSVDRIVALQNGQPVNVPAGSVNIGDRFRLFASFDTTNAELTSLYDADPTTNIYWLPDAHITWSIGSGGAAFTPLFPFNASMQLWNDRVIVDPTDSQSLSFFRYQAPASEVPFALGSGLISYSLDAMAFDWTATARSDDLITTLVPMDRFGSRVLQVGFLNFDTNLFVQVSATVSELNLSSVPEPRSWMLLLVGFGAVGFVARRKSAATARESLP